MYKKAIYGTVKLCLGRWVVNCSDLQL